MKHVISLGTGLFLGLAMFACGSDDNSEFFKDEAVNVALKNPDGSENVLAYSKECTSADGWRYDDPKDPKRILLCNSSCTAARASQNGTVSIAFGCKTKINVQ